MWELKHYSAIVLSIIQGDQNYFEITFKIKAEIETELNRETKSSTILQHGYLRWLFDKLWW